MRFLLDTPTPAKGLQTIEEFGGLFGSCSPDYVRGLVIDSLLV